MEIYTKREQVEWSNFYWDNANSAELPRILLIGDSISVGYRPFVAEQLKGKYNVDLFATSKSITDYAYKKELNYILNDYQYKAIHFNNGLHGWHLDDFEYSKGLLELVEILKNESNKPAPVWATSTPVTEVDNNDLLDTIKNEIVIKRNIVAEKIMVDNAIPINDIYNLVLGKADIRLLDKYHYNKNGQLLQATAVCSAIEKAILFNN